ncbi:translocation/assembly module TamB domain-containing protein [Carboxylicivirga taeanensis]|uniref:translocation/assembly module TamB domain-containing protein n=1 Tax=Carboxylicivirga taeanensis TaxID=1416875 RepID=UPI003F6DBFB9
MAKKLIKYTLVLIAAILLVALSLLVLMQTNLFKELVRKKVVSVTSAMINGDLELGRIDGNFFNSLKLYDVALTENDSVLIAIDSVHLKYDLRQLRKKKLTIDSLIIYSPEVKSFYKDSATLQLAYVFNKLGASATEKSSGFSWKINVAAAKLVDGQGSYQPEYGSPSVLFNNIELLVSASLAENDLGLVIEEAALDTHNPSLSIKQGHIRFNKEGSSLQLDSLFLRSAKSLIHAKGQFVTIDSFSVNIIGSPISREEMQAFLPKLPVRTIPELSLQVVAAGGELSGYLELLNDRRNGFEVNGLISDSVRLILARKSGLRYQLGVVSKEVVPEDWLVIDSTGVTINGALEAMGDDVFNPEIGARIKAKLNKSAYNNIVFDTLEVVATQLNNNGAADVLITFLGSRSEGHLRVRDLFNEPLYEASFDTKSLLLGAINPSLKNTVLNGNLVMSGTNILNAHPKISAQASLTKSRLFDYEIDSLRLISTLIDSILQVDTCLLVDKYNKVFATGRYALATQAFSVDAALSTTDLSALDKYGLPPFDFTNGFAKVSLNGSPEAFNYSGLLHFDDVLYQSVAVDTIKGVFEGAYSQNDSLAAAGHLFVTNIVGESPLLDSVSCDFNFLNRRLWSSVSFSKANLLDGAIESELMLGDTIHVCLSSAALASPFANYQLTDTIQQGHFYGKTLSIDNFSIRDEQDSAFRMMAHGTLGLTDSLNFELGIEHFNLQQLNGLLNQKDSVKGVLSIHTSLLGNPENLFLKGTYRVQDPVFGDMALPTVTGELGYKADTFSVSTWLPQLDSSVHARMSLPAKIRLDSTNSFALDYPETFEATLVVDSLMLSTPDIPEYSYRKASAKVNGSIEAKGQFSKPLFYGQMELHEGNVFNHQAGLYYNNVSAALVFDGQEIKIDTLFIGSDKGYFASKGYLLFDTTIVSGRVDAANVITSINNFHLVNHRNYDINISGNPYYKTDSAGYPQFGGEVLVNRSSFYIPGLMDGEQKKVDELDAPLLVLATEKSDTTIEKTDPIDTDKVPLLLKKLKGRLTIEIPRSTWIKGDNMNLEIGGDFDIAKNGDYFELFGDVEIIRGNYILYGRKFNIEEGVITFMGGEKTDPRLNIIAEYVFRGSDRKKHSLKLSVTERLSEPNISFTLDDSSISQSDAVSIMVFGKTLDELSYAGQNGIVGSVGTNMLANMVTSSLNSTIGQRFKLDMIEVNATENWTSAAFVVGKYITNDLFVIYQRGFGETEDDEITPETITLEYEVNKLLFIRLQGGTSKSSGFDVILKLESTK